MPVHEAGAFRALKQVDQALSRFEPLRMKSFHAAEKNSPAGRSRSNARQMHEEYLIRIAYHAIRMIDDPIVQVQGGRTNLARQSSRKFPGDIQDRALRKLRQLDAAATVEDLRNPPGNRLETLKGDRAGQMSVRINDQWRICFRWSKGDADDVEIVDYHS